MGGYSPYPEDEEYALPQPQLPVDPAANMAALRQEQASALAQHQQAATDLQQRQAQWGEREADVQLSDRLLKVMDPRVPKPARDFLFRELSQTLGIDPAGQRSKDIGKMLTSLAPDELETLQQSFVDRMASAKPGELTKMMRGLLSGQTDANAFIGEIMKTSAVQAAGAAGQPGEGDEAERPQTAQAPGSRRDEVETIVEGMGDRRRLPTPGETEPRFQPADPGLVQALGLNPKTRYRNDDLINEGYNVPIDPKAQRDLAQEIKTSASTGIDVSLAAARAHALFKGRPEVLGVVGATARTVDQVLDQIKGAVQVVGGDLSSAGPSDSGIKAMAKNLAGQISSMYKSSGIPQTAVDSARLQGAIIDMAYSMAIARGIPGNRLTNAIIAQHMNTLGHSQSVEQFEATLADTVRRVSEKTPNLISSRIGRRDVTPDLGFVSDDDIKALAMADTTPPNLKQQLLKEVKLRKAGSESETRGKDINRAGPTLEEEDTSRRKEEELRQRRLQDRETREQDDALLRKQADLRADQDQSLREDRFEYQVRKDRYDRDERLRLEKDKRALERRKMIGEAFEELGKAIGRAGSVSGSISAGGGSQGAGQDVGAFRIAPPPNRRMPQVPERERRR